MGYDLHITRKQDWFDKHGPRITEQEWRDYVSSDPEMTITGFAEAKTPKGEVIRIEDPLLAEWDGHSKYKPVWFSYYDGVIIVKSPDAECISKMREVAEKLCARIQGDEGEYY
ncbi:MAG TPA: hypothetical protein VKX17_21295 [Planctomycetota bacterium]|nr:hypothetical protein [Planctomycetota bacterium]